MIWQNNYLDMRGFAKIFPSQIRWSAVLTTSHLSFRFFWQSNVSSLCNMAEQRNYLARPWFDKTTYVIFWPFSGFQLFGYIKPFFVICQNFSFQFGQNNVSWLTWFCQNISVPDTLICRVNNLSFELPVFLIRCFAMSQLHRMLKIRCFAMSQLHRMLNIRCFAKSQAEWCAERLTRCLTKAENLKKVKIWHTLFCQIHHPWRLY